MSGVRAPAVVVGFAEALAAPETVFSLLDGGYRVVALRRRGSTTPLRRLRAVRLLDVTAPEESAEQAVADLRSAVRAAGAACWMPLDDAAVWLTERAGDLGVRVAGATGEQARLALDKERQIALAAAAGLLVPETRHYEQVRAAAELSDFPAVLKPARAVDEREGRLVRGSPVLCAGPEELAAGLDRLALAGPVLAQPLLRGVGEGVFGLVVEGRVSAWSAHRRIRMMNPQGSGSSACGPAPVDPELREPIERLLAAAGWEGLFMVELLRDRGGRAWFMELNGRPWGSMALARRMGLEYPAWAVRALLEPGFRPQEPGAASDRIVCRHLGRELVHLALVLRGPRSAAAAWPPRARTAAAVLRVGRRDRWYNWRRGEAALFVDDLVQTLRGELLRKRRR